MGWEVLSLPCRSLNSTQTLTLPGDRGCRGMGEPPGYFNRRKRPLREYNVDHGLVLGVGGGQGQQVAKQSHVSRF